MRFKGFSVLVFCSCLLGPALVSRAGTDPVENSRLDELPDLEAHRFVAADENQSEDDNFILRSVNDVLKEPLRLGWIIPPDLLMVDKKTEMVSAYGAGIRAESVQYQGPLSPKELADIRGRYHMICDPYSNYFVYRLTGPVAEEAQRVLVSAAPLPGGQVYGQSVSLSPEQLDKALQALDGKGKFVHHYRALGTPDGSFTYSFHGFYDPSTHQLMKSGIVFQGKGSKVLAATLEKFDPAQGCEGCDMPRSDEPLERVYDPIALVQTTLFPEPLVLLRGQANGSQSLSLLTFDSKGRKAEVWATEGLADCGR